MSTTPESMELQAAARKEQDINLSGKLRGADSMVVLILWAALAVLFSAMWALGISPASDSDDLLKLHQLRALPLTDGWFDRTVPGILQPEPFVSHWSVLADIPYAVVIGLLEWLVGRDAALNIAAFSVPLLLLLPALYFYRTILARLGFDRVNIALIVAVVLSLNTFFEFVPGRVDYHNLGIVLLLGSIALSLSTKPIASAAAGAAMAVCLAMSIEFVAFFAVVMGIHAVGFMCGDAGSTARIRSFGLALALVSALMLFALVSPGTYLAAKCDAYSLPQALALVCGGGAFAVVGTAANVIKGSIGRAALIVFCGALTLALLAWLFPQCLDNPYSGLSQYVRENWLASILQEKSILSRHDLLPGSVCSLALVAIGTSALVAAAIADRFRTRSVAAAALLAVIALAQAFLYSRYFPYAPLFAAPGLLLAMSALVPAGPALSRALSGHLKQTMPSAAVMIAPGLAVAFATAVAIYLTPTTLPSPATAAIEFSGRCSLTGVSLPAWPAGSVVLVPPPLGKPLLGTDPHLSVNAVTNHPSWAGIERSYRFFDPATPDPRVYLDQSKATHVMLCARGANSLPDSYQFVSGLAAARPPQWLEPCPLGPDSPVVIYRYPSAGGAAALCPV